MAEHQIEARILLRYDTISNWLSSSLILKQGEAAVAVYPTRNTLNRTGAIPENTPPAVGIKIGDGQHYFDELPWVQAVAADIYPWAKQVTKPIYDASEITNLDTYISQHGGGSSGISSSSYRLTYNENAHKYVFQYYDNTLEAWVNTDSEVDFSDIYEHIQYLEDWANGARLVGPYLEQTLVLSIRDELLLQLEKLTVEDEAVAHEFVTQVTETNGKIKVSRKALSASDITSGILPVEFGGTGLSEIPNNEVLIGNIQGVVTTRPVITRINDPESNELVTALAVSRYVDNATAGLTGAMHFIGEATVTITNGSAVDPQINGYVFRQAEPGDVILGDRKEEYVWTGSNWRLLGDEGSYVVKGSITNADFADGAEIQIDKIADLSNILNTKVDKVEGKSLSTNDFTTEYKQKLDGIEDNAQRNLIEHIYINGTEATPAVIDGKPNSLAIRLSSLTPEEEEKLRGIESNAQVNLIEHIFLNEEELPIKTVKTLQKSINIELLPYTEAEQLKLAGIAEGAQVNTIEGITVNGAPIAPDNSKIVAITIPDHKEHENKIEHIFFNGTEFTPNNDKEVHVTIDEAALNLQVIKGAIIPKGNNETEDVEIDTTMKKLKLARIAATGNIEDILQTANTYVTLNCGSSTVNI